MSEKQDQVLGLPTSIDPGILGEKTGIEFIEVTPQRVVARMPVAGNTQPVGLLHAGASLVLAESLGSIGAVMHAGQGQSRSGSRSTPLTTERPGKGSSPASRLRCR